jgi:hypothetical protein
VEIIIVYVHKKDSGAVERFYGMRLKMGNNVMITRFFVFVVVLCSALLYFTVFVSVTVFFLVLIPTHPRLNYEMAFIFPERTVSTIFSVLRIFIHWEIGNRRK